MNWREQASCATLPETVYDRLFFENGNPAAAQRICSTCPVQQECHQFADLTRIPHGVYGGESGASRRARLGITLFEDQVDITATPTPIPTDDPEDWWWRVA